ncbi:lamin tail domain-containing protein [Streptomyces sp. NPDC046831]|uniref:lamin tail domain-containing protein n=1 Tax=Streptomyces sp. NPDC046831 TaxID=3154805 RepID=UPI0033EF76F8
MTVSASVIARRLAAAVAAAGALVGAATLPATAADHAHPHHREHVQISNVHHDSAGRHHRSSHSLSREYVVLTNSGRHAVNLSGWTLSDRAGHTYTFHHYRLDGRSSVRVHTGFGRDTRTDLYQDRRNSVWDRRDTATLRDNHRHVVDTVSWGGDRHHRGGRH